MRRTARYMRGGISDDVVAYKRGKKRTLRYRLNSRTLELRVLYRGEYKTLRSWVGIAEVIGPLYSPYYGTRAYGFSRMGAADARRKARQHLSDNVARRGYIGRFRLSSVDAADEVMRPCAAYV